MTHQIEAYRALKAGQVLTQSLRYGATLSYREGRPPLYHVRAWIQDKRIASGVYEELARALRRSAAVTTVRSKGRLDLADTDQCRKLALWLSANLDKIARPEAASAWSTCVRLTAGGTTEQRADAVTVLNICQALEPPVLLCALLHTSTS